MEFRIVSEDRYEELFGHMQRDFPKPGELAPFHAIQRNLESGRYEGFFLHDDIEIGYMVVMAPEDTRLVFGNYFAIHPEFRSKGYGTKFLRRILEKYHDRSFVIEVSDPAHAASLELRNECLKRVSFYEHAGFETAPTVRARIFGADMLIMATNLYDGFSARDAMLSLYKPPEGVGALILENIDVIDE